MSMGRDTQQAWTIWQGGRRPDPQHPYLLENRIGPMQLRQTRHGALILPLCIRGTFQGVRLIHWDLSRPVITIGGESCGYVVPTARHKDGQPLVVVVDWPSAVALHKQGLIAWACLSQDNLGVVASQARSMLGPNGRLLIAGDNSKEGAHRADLVATLRDGELMLPGRPIGAPKWVETFGDLERWNAGVRRAIA